MRHPREMGAQEVEAFLTMLATERRVSASTHNQALSALLFLYREVLAIDLPWLNGVNRPAQKRRIPSVMTKEEVAALFQFLDPDMRLLAQPLSGTGMRLMEGLRLRIRDMDFDRHVIIVREAKGNKDRVVMLPRALGRVGVTPDRDALKRNKDLFLRIRKSHPHNMRPVGYRLHDHQEVLSDLARIELLLPHFSAVLALMRERLQLSFARQRDGSWCDDRSTSS